MICAGCGEAVAAVDGTQPETCPACGAPLLLRGRYRIESVLAHAANAVTYRGVRIEDGLAVALKELPFYRLASFEPLDRLKRESEILRQLDHPSIPRILDEFQTGQGRRMSVWLVQSFVEGVDLERRLEHHRFCADEVRQVVHDVAEILAFLHERQPAVVHRDIKPSNLILRNEGEREAVGGRLALIDFGAVRDVVPGREAGRSTVAGTFGYMAPEQIRGEVLPATDVYGLGATALRLLTREDPARLVDYTGAVRTEIAERLPPPFDRIREMMAVDPSQRLPNGGAVLAFLRGERAPAVVRQASPIKAPARPTARPLISTADASLAAAWSLIGYAGFGPLGALAACAVVLGLSSDRKGPPVQMVRHELKRSVPAALATAGLAVATIPVSLYFFSLFGLVFFGLPFAAFMAVVSYQFATEGPSFAYPWPVDERPAAPERTPPAGRRIEPETAPTPSDES